MFEDEKITFARSLTSYKLGYISYTYILKELKTTTKVRVHIPLKAGSLILNLII